MKQILKSIFRPFIEVGKLIDSVDAKIISDEGHQILEDYKNSNYTDLTEYFNDREDIYITK